MKLKLVVTKVKVHAPNAPRYLAGGKEVQTASWVGFQLPRHDRCGSVRWGRGADETVSISCAPAEAGRMAEYVGQEVEFELVLPPDDQSPDQPMKLSLVVSDVQVPYEFASKEAPPVGWVGFEIPRPTHSGPVGWSRDMDCVSTTCAPAEAGRLAEYVGREVQFVLVLPPTIIHPDQGQAEESGRSSRELAQAPQQHPAEDAAQAEVGVPLAPQGSGSPPEESFGPSRERCSADRSPSSAGADA